MRILFLTVNNNYHAPLLLRQIFPQLVDDEIFIFISQKDENLTPKQILKRYGWKYTAFKVMERIKLKSLLFRERIRKLDINKREYLTLSEVLTHFEIPSQTTLNIHQDLATIKRFQPDLIISLYFDQIIKESLLSLCSYPPLNLHPSLLPAYAGSSPTFWVLAKGESITGISIHEITKEVDKGKLVFQQIIDIKPEDTQFSLYRRCTMHYAKPLLNCIEICRRGEDLPTTPIRDDIESSYYFKITKKDIDEFLARNRKFI